MRAVQIFSIFAFSLLPAISMADIDIEKATCKVGYLGPNRSSIDSSDLILSIPLNGQAKVRDNDGKALSLSFFRSDMKSEKERVAQRQTSLVPNDAFLKIRFEDENGHGRVEATLSADARVAKAMSYIGNTIYLFSCCISSDVSGICDLDKLSMSNFEP